MKMCTLKRFTEVTVVTEMLLKKTQNRNHTVSKLDTDTQLVSPRDPCQMWCQLGSGTKFMYDIGLCVISGKQLFFRRYFRLYQAVSQIEGERKGVGPNLAPA